MDLPSTSHIDTSGAIKLDNKSLVYGQENPGNLDTLESQNQVRRFGFSINKNLNLLVQEGIYCELIIDVNLAPLPFSPKHVAGLLNLRGNIITVYALNAFIEREQPPARYAYLIGKPSEGAALLVDEKPKIVNIATQGKQIPPDQYVNEKLRPFIDTSYSIDNISWHSLDHSKLFLALAESKE